MAVNSTYYLNAADLTTATAVYLDALLVNIAPDGFYKEGTVVRQQLGGVLLDIETCPTCFTESAMRSEIGVADPEAVDVCLEDLDTPVFIVTSVEGDITSGDIVCNSDDPLDTFYGGDLYYRLSLDSDPSNSKVCQIDADGVLLVLTVCS